MYTTFPPYLYNILVYSDNQKTPELEDDFKSKALTLKSLMSLGNSSCTVLTHKYYLVGDLIVV